MMGYNTAMLGTEGYRTGSFKGNSSPASNSDIENYYIQEIESSADTEVGLGLGASQGHGYQIAAEENIANDTMEENTLVRYLHNSKSN